MEKRRCPECRKPFVPSSHRQKYCSRECRTFFLNAKHRKATGPIKRRGPRKNYERSTICVQCGKGLRRGQRRFCSLACSEGWWAEKKNKGKAATYHVLSDIDTETMTGTCSQCGPGATVVRASKLRENQRFRCRVAVRKDSLTPVRKRHQWKRRGIDLTWEEHQAMLEAQQGRCAICERPMDQPHVDHCHDTGKVRGLLCSSCNNGLGRFADDPARLRAAATYLERAS